MSSVSSETVISPSSRAITPIYVANPEIARIVLAQAAELGRQPDFRADSRHLCLAYMVHHILRCALREEIILPEGVDIAAANRFVEAVFEGANRLSNPAIATTPANRTGTKTGPAGMNGTNTSGAYQPFRRKHRLPLPARVQKRLS